MPRLTLLLSLAVAVGAWGGSTDGSGERNLTKSVADELPGGLVSGAALGGFKLQRS